MEKKLGVVPSFYAGTASCQGTTPNSCKIFQYRGEVPAAGTIVGNTIPSTPHQQRGSAPRSEQAALQP